MPRTASWAVAVLCTGLAACGSCSKEDDKGADAAPASPLSSAAVAAVVAEPLPRCRRGPERLLVPGEEVVVGDVAIGPTGLLAGVVRLNGGKRVASVLRTSLALDGQTIVDLGTPLGDDPPPSPHWNGTTAWVAYIASHSTDAGTRQREIVVKTLDDGKNPLTIAQQADESTAFDVAWSESNSGLIAWDEDGPPVLLEGGAPKKKDAEPMTRGLVKVQKLAAGTAPVLASPPTSDADSPRLVPRAGGGFWLAWLARRAEEEALGVEGPGEPRAFRWVEVIALEASGQPQGPVRRVGSEKGRAVAFELARSGADLIVMVQDEIGVSDGARLVRHKLGPAPGKAETSDIVKDGVGHAFADLVPAVGSGESARWISWNDTNEHAHLTALGPGLITLGKSSSEPSLEGARVLASSGDAIFALAGVDPSSPATPGSPGRAEPELLRFVCP